MRRIEIELKEKLIFFFFFPFLLLFLDKLVDKKERWKPSGKPLQPLHSSPLLSELFALDDVHEARFGWSVARYLHVVAQGFPEQQVLHPFHVSSLGVEHRSSVPISFMVRPSLIEVGGDPDVDGPVSALLDWSSLCNTATTQPNTNHPTALVVT